MADRPAFLALDDHLCFAIYSTGLAIGRAYKPLLDALDITYPQYLVMNVLWEEDGQPVGAIGERLGLESSTLTPLLKRLETNGFVRRARNPEDERQVLIGLTGKGRALREKAGCIAEELLSISKREIPALKQLNTDVRGLRDSIVEGLAAR